MKIKINKFIYISYFLLLSASMFSNITILKYINNIFKYSALFIMSMCLLIQVKNIEKKKIFFIIISVLVFFISFIKSKDYSLFFLIILLFSMKQIEFNDFIKKDMYFRIGAILFVLVMYWFGFTDNYYALRDNGLVRSSMGFSHPNSFGIYVLSVCADYIYLKFNKLKLYDYLFLLFSSYIISIFSNSRTSQIAILILILLCLVINKFKVNISIPKFAKFVLMCLPIFLITISLYLGNNYGNISKLNQLNKILSGRLSYANYYLNNYSINCFGNYLLTTDDLSNTNKALILDNSYLTLLLKYGLISTIIFIYIIEEIIVKGFKNQDNALIVIMFVFLIISFSENYLFQYQTNVFLIYFMACNIKKGAINDEKVRFTKKKLYL